MTALNLTETQRRALWVAHKHRALRMRGGYGNPATAPAGKAGVGWFASRTIHSLEKRGLSQSGEYFNVWTISPTGLKAVFRMRTAHG